MVLLDSDELPGGYDRQAWRELGAALARSASALDAVLVEELSDNDREHATKARRELQRALDEYREANRRLSDA